MPKRVQLYDTTLRDGSQRAGISFSLEDKLHIAVLLDQHGFDYIEGGWPASNPKDTAFFHRIGNRLRHAKVTAFGSTMRRGLRPEDDFNLRALLDAKTPAVTIFGKASPFHATEILGLTLEENLRCVEDSVRFLKKEGREVIFDAEHFFDGASLDRDYALRVLDAACSGGADTVVLCDTNGGTLPGAIAELTAEVVGRVGRPVGIHTHDDTGCGVANSLVAVQAGAGMVQGTINGYGERCGNANLCTIWPDLVFKLGYAAGGGEQALEGLSKLARTVAEIANLAPEDGAPFVGENAFTHKAGVHVGAVRRHPSAYEHMVPEKVGQARKILVSELSGKSNLLYRFEKELSLAPEEAGKLVQEVKALEARGYQFEEAGASVELLVHKARGTLPAYFTVDRFHVSVMREQKTTTEATVRVSVGPDTILEVADGDGPVHALDSALRKALVRFYPVLKDLRLTDYKVRILDTREATAAAVRVLVHSEFGGEPVHTVGVSPNILEASWQALVDAVTYSLWRADAQAALAKGRKKNAR